MGLKTVFYISEPLSKYIDGGLPTEFSTIHRQSRINNQRSGITGLLSFSAGRYLQILEGAEEEIDRTFEKIEKDPRHRLLAVLVNQPTGRHFFEECPMRVVACLDDCTELKEYLVTFEASIDQLPHYAKRLLDTFTNKTSKTSAVFEEKELKLSNWPDFTKIRQTPLVLGLSARLVSGPESYKSLASSGEFGTQTQLDKILRSFELMGILIVSDDERNDGRLAISHKSNGELAFYHRVKAFLGL